MSDIDDRDELANAYLDGEVTADERARVDGDPRLLARVETLRQVRALVADVEEPSISVRELQLAAALDSWDRLPGAAASTDATPTSLDHAAAGAITRPRASSAGRASRWNRRLVAAAAAAVVVVGAGIALQTLTRIGDDDSTTADDASTADDAAADVADDARAAAEPPAAIEQDAAPAAGDDVDTDEALLDTAESGTISTGRDDPAPPPDDDLQQLTSPDDLAVFASLAVGAPYAETGPAPTAPNDATTGEQLLIEGELPLCLGADVLVGPARYLDEVVVVAIDEGRDLALAYLPADCVEVARAALP
jgi:hypothetical protein